jgi:catechol 2,3-dioxygenase-like lactoylglutathione lyase family enzyme
MPSRGRESPFTQIRVARPTDKLTEVIAFYEHGLGLKRVDNFENHAGYCGVMLGTPTSRFHLEFTHKASGSPCPAPTKDNLLVLYFHSARAYRDAVKRMKDQGHNEVEPDNPYWIGRSITFEDPDGWRVVICREKGISKKKEPTNVG